MSRVILFCLVIGFFFVTCVSGVLSTHKHIQSYFEMPDYVGPVPQHVQSAVLERVKLGSSREDVEQYLHRRGIGVDGNSTCEPSAQERRLTCYIGTHSHVWNVVRERFSVSFVFDSQATLNDVQVQSRFEALR